MVKSGYLRTSESRFEELPNFDFDPNYEIIEDIRVHYVDEGEGDPILLLHGEPSWSFLYRKMIPPLVNAGFRAIAPDLIGFGRSDKPKSRSQHSYQKHVNWMIAFFDKLDLNNVTMFLQDWGGLIGFRVVAERQGRISRIAAGNTGFPHAGGITGLLGYNLFKLRIWLKGSVTQEKLSENPNFINWVAYSQTVSDFPVSDIIQWATLTNLSDEIKNAYDAPFPDNSYKEGPRVMPILVPSQLRLNHKIWLDIYKNWKKPFLLCFSDSDPITRGGDKQFLKGVPGTKGVNHHTISDAGHFLQEDKGELIAKHLVNFIEKTS